MKKSFFSLLVLVLGVVNSENQLVEPIMGISWFEMIGYLVYTILWTINRNHHKNIQILIHKLIYAVLILELILSAINSIFYTIMFKYPEDQFLKYATPTISLFMNISILLLSILLVSGLSIVYESLNSCQLALIILSTAIFSVALYTLEFITKVEYNFIFFLIMLTIFIIGYVFYFSSIVYLSKLATEALIVHLDMIAQRGINPNSTPSYKKINMLKFTRNSSVSLFFIMVLCYTLFYAEILPYWTIYGIKTIAMLILVGIICYKCRIRKAMAGTYGDDEDAYVIHEDENDNCGNINDLNHQIKQEMGLNTYIVTKETQDIMKNNINSIRCESKERNSSEAEDDGYCLKNIGDNEGESKNYNTNEDNSNDNKRIDWSPDMVLPSIPQIHKLHVKIYSKDPDE